MNLGRGLDDTARLLTDQTRVLAESGETYTVTGAIASTDRPFRVTLAWTDAPGATTGGPWVNNLDLEVTINGQTYLGNVFSGPSSITGGAADGKNNVESVFLPPGVSGSFTVTVRGANIAGDGVPGNDDTTDQDFALVIYNATPDTPLIGFRPAGLNFAASVGGANPVNQTLDISNLGIGIVDWTASENAPWLTIGPTNGAAPSTLTVVVDISGLSIGTYTGTITIRSAQASNSPVTVPVALTILPVFAVNPSKLNFTAIAGAATRPSQPVNISNNDSIPRSWTASVSASWLKVTPASGTAPSPLTVAVDTRGLSAGTYSGSIKITPTNVPNSPITVPVTLTLLPIFGVNPSSPTFSAVVNSGDPPPEAIDISSNDQAPRNWAAKDNASWLTVGPASGSTPSRLKVSVDIRGLRIGTYQATITLTPVDVTASPIKVPVTLIIDRFVNGGFEEDIAPWVVSGAARRSKGAYPHGGRGYLMLGGGDSSRGFAYQEVALPPRSSPKLAFWLNVESGETATELKDKLFVEVRDTRGALLKTLATFSNLDQSTPGNYTLRGNYSLADFAGQAVRIQFRTKTDSSAITNFRIDDAQVR